jgi:hypothetical protein
MVVFKTEEQIAYEREMDRRDMIVKAKEASFRRECARRDPFKEFRRGYVPPPKSFFGW